MTLREQIVEEVNHISDENLEELYSIIKEYETKAYKPKSNVLAELCKIKISASSTFSLDADIYMEKEENAR